jgi:thiol-disulfide isomerase/thioredoxin
MHAARSHAAIALVLLVACQSGDPAPRDHGTASESAAAPSVSPTGPVVLEAAPADGEVAALVKARAAVARAAGRVLLVYVGASWCEPCHVFRDAAARGELDASFPGLTLLEFDADRDNDRLERAGYGSKLVPLFVRPDADGRGGTRRTSGVRRGSDAVADLAPRLHSLLD